jgi:hypothetical protein
MKAACYQKQGAARDVLEVGDMPDPVPAAGEVRIRIAASGINPGDIRVGPASRLANAFRSKILLVPMNLWNAQYVAGALSLQCRRAVATG